MTKRRLAIWLAWKNFSEYYSRQLAEAIKDHYDTTITYKAMDWDKFDVVLCFFPFPKRKPKCDRKKIVKFVWEPHEFGHAADANLVLAACTLILKKIKHRYKDRALLVPWAANPDHFFPQPFPKTNKLIVGWAGAHKNNRKLYPKLEETIMSMGDPIVWHPNWVTKRKYTLETMHQYYAQIHVYVCGSANEGFCFPLLEAAACGRPIVTFDVGVARDLQDSGAGVIIIENRDYEAMKAAIRDIDYVTLGGKSAEAVKQHWLWKHLKDRWLEVLNQVGRET